MDFNKIIEKIKNLDSIGRLSLIRWALVAFAIIMILLLSASMSTLSSLVLTSGSTINTCLELVLQCHPKKVELMVLSTHQNLEELKKRFKN